jgi:hypothetical protein
MQASFLELWRASSERRGSWTLDCGVRVVFGRRRKASLLLLTATKSESPPSANDQSLSFFLNFSLSPNKEVPKSRTQLSNLRYQLTAKMFSQAITSVFFLASFANAHFSIEYPQWRGDSFATGASQYIYPCKCLYLFLFQISKG